jgi:hypothetical protein
MKLLSMNFWKVKQRSYLEKIKSLFQSILAILEQCAHLSLTKESLDLAATLLGFNKGMDFVQSPK